MNKQVLINTLMQYSSFLKTYSKILKEKKGTENYEVLLEFSEGLRTNLSIEEIKSATHIRYTQELKPENLTLTRHLEAIFDNESGKVIHILESLKNTSHSCTSRSYLLVKEANEELIHNTNKNGNWTKKRPMMDPLLFTRTDIVPLYQNGIQIPVYKNEFKDAKEYILRKENEVNKKLLNTSLYRR